MKRKALLIILMLYSFISFSQKSTPTYIDIIKNFCSNYEPSEDYYDYTCFAKKKDGWYVMQVNKVKSDEVLKERLFFSYKENKYFELDEYYTKAEKPELEKQFGKYLNYGGSTSDWYGFERIAYYGYNGWFNDMIKDFGSRQDLTDTMYDGLARAYISLAHSYSWYQTGGLATDDDTLHRKLNRLEYPTQQRIDKLKEGIDSAIIQFEKLSKLNPVYKTVVGNATLKVFNEYMHGYDQMTMCGNDILAKEYIEKAHLSQLYILQAKNYLNSCEPNSILFTYGDNDTYQLWYVQEKFNFRKDILVINYSLLGLPVYIDMFKRKKMLTVSIPDLYLKDQGSDISYFTENKKIADAGKPVSLKDFLKTIYTKKYPSEAAEGFSYPTYPYSKASLLLPVYGNKALNGVTQKNILFDLSKNYYYVNDIAIFDIISNNINKRPVYFTSLSSNPFENNVIQTGIVYKLIAEDINSPLQNAKAIKRLEKFINEKYIPVLSNGSTLISFDGDNTFFSLYYRIFNYYLEKKDTAAFKKWLYRITVVCPEINNTQINVARYLAYYYFEAGESKKGLIITDQYAQWLHNAYINPNSLNGYYTKEAYLGELTKTKDYLASKNLNSPLIDRLLEK
ncbi:MAG TPA: hypothetical protein VK484_13610 [Ferruginibacter sp.]|nr:hypothetical protein [Ferruginibacter sp.]